MVITPSEGHATTSLERHTTRKKKNKNAKDGGKVSLRGEKTPGALGKMVFLKGKKTVKNRGCKNQLRRCAVSRERVETCEQKRGGGGLYGNVVNSTCGGWNTFATKARG